MVRFSFMIFFSLLQLIALSGKHSKLLISVLDKEIITDVWELRLGK